MVIKIYYTRRKAPYQALSPSSCREPAVLKPWPGVKGPSWPKIVRDGMPMKILQLDVTTGYHMIVKVITMYYMLLQVTT